VNVVPPMIADFPSNAICECGHAYLSHGSSTHYCFAPVDGKYCQCPSFRLAKIEKNLTLVREAIKTRWKIVDRAKAEVEEIARKFIPDYHFLDYRVSNFWECDKSPIGWCVFKLEEKYGNLHPTHCKFCGQPVERK
jgi:hypothetical protein